MKNRKELKDILIGLFCFVAILALCILAGLFGDKAIREGLGSPVADFRDGVGAGVFVESTETNGIHTPITATVPGVSASVMTSLFTSGTAAIEINTASGIATAFDLVEIRANYSAASSTQTFVARIDSGAGTEFDAVFLSSAVSTTATILRLDPPMSFRAVDSLKIDYPNANGDIVGVEIVTKQP